MSNFGHLCQYIDEKRHQKLHQIAFRGIRAEVYFVERDYNTCLMLCRQMIENLFKWLAQDNDIPLHKADGTERALLNIINDVSQKIGLSDYVIKNLHNIRKLGNKAIHDMDCNDADEAIAGLKDLYEVFYSLFKFRYAPKNFVPQGFQEPTLALIVPYIQQILDMLNNPSPPSTKQPTASPTPSKQKTEAKATVLSSNQAGFNGKHLIRQAVEARKKGNHQESERLLKEVLKSNPDSPEALYHLALCYENSSSPNKKNQVIALLEQATELGHFYAPTRLAKLLLEETPNTNETRQRIWELLKKGAVNGKDNQADMVYADIYEKGLLGNSIDIQQAIKHLQKAKDKGNTKAQEHIERLQHQLAQSVNTTHTKPQTQDDIESKEPENNVPATHNEDWQWWTSLDDTWRELLITKGLHINHNQLELLNEQRMMPYITKILRLNRLDLKACSIDDIQPLSNLTHLKTIYLSGNNISDIQPLAQLTRLEALLLKENNISDITALTNLRWLTVLSLEKNSICDIQPLANLTSLKALDLDGNTVNSIEPLTRLVWLKELHLKENNISDITPLTNLTQLNTLSLDDNNIDNIEPLRVLTQITHLNLDNNHISDITPLTNLTQLNTLSLDDNNIDNIEPLRVLTQITRLDLDNNHISDITPLTGLTQLETLFLRYNNISDITPLTNLKQLKNLSLSDNIVDTIQPLENLLQLEKLHIKNNNISDITPLAKLKRLKTLTMENNPFDDIRPLAKLTRLEELDLDYCNNIGDITPLTNLTKLTTLLLKATDISDIAPLANLKQLRKVNLASNNISDITPLTQLTNLDKDSVNLTGNPIDPKR
ncbi:MAG: leucine-rich repeat domain-containing protein [Moraxella sp.]|nr:leucine-rich repeat domain-containing protein [Moraxella sp.]